MGTILAICAKDLRLLLRDRAGLFFTFAFPLLYALFFGFVFSGGGQEGTRRIPLRLVDLDSSAASGAFLDSVATRPGVDAVRDSLPGAETALRRGRATAALVVPKGFGARSLQPFGGEAPAVELLHDPARKAEALLLQGVLMELAFKGLEQRFSTPRAFLPQVRAWRDSLARSSAPQPRLEALRRWTRELDLFLESQAVADSLARAHGGAAGVDAGFLKGWEPLHVRVRERVARRAGPHSAFEISFPQGLLWGILSVAASFGVSLVVERREGTLRRLRAAALRRRHILAGKALACFLAIFVLVLLLIFVGRPFGVVAERPLLLLAAGLATAFAFTGLMLLISVLGRSERAVSGLAWSLLTVLAMLGGGMVPLFLMPEWLRALGTVSPVKWSILALEGALWRGFGWAELLPVCGVLMAFGALCGFVGLKAFRWGDS